jgi:hypothetical protein
MLPRSHADANNHACRGRHATRRDGLSRHPGNLPLRSFCRPDSRGPCANRLAKRVAETRRLGRKWAEKCALVTLIRPPECHTHDTSFPAVQSVDGTPRGPQKRPHGLL